VLQLQRGLLWIGGGVLAVVVSQVLLALGSLLGILLFPVAAFCALYGIFLLRRTTTSQGRWSEPLDWSIAAAALIGAGVFAWLDRDWTILVTTVVVVSLVVVARRRRARLARDWQEHGAPRRPTMDHDGIHGS